MNRRLKDQVAMAYKRMMQGVEISPEQRSALDESGFREMRKMEKDEERLRFLSDQNKSKGMSAAEKRYETSKIWGGRRGGPVAGLAGGYNISARQGEGDGSEKSSTKARLASPRQMKKIEEMAWNMPASNFSNYA